MAKPSLAKPSLLQLTIFFKRSFSPLLSQAPYASFVDTQSSFDASSNVKLYRNLAIRTRISMYAMLQVVSANKPFRVEYLITYGLPMQLRGPKENGW